MQQIIAPFASISIPNNTIFYNLVGNFIPPEWRELTSSEGKVLSKTARQILSLIVSCLKSDNNESKKLEELQESYYYFEKAIGVCQKRIRQCLLELRDGGFIQLTLTTVIKHYVKCRNIPCIKLAKNFEPYKKNISTEPERNFGQDGNNFHPLHIIDNNISIYKSRYREKSNFINKNLEISNKEEGEDQPQPQEEINNPTALSDSSSSFTPLAPSTPLSTLINKAKTWCRGKKLSEFHPLSEEDASILQFRSNREFNLNFINKLLLKLAEQYPNNKFYNKSAVLTYMTKALTYEMRKAEAVNNEGFKFGLETAIKAREEYLAKKEYSLETSGEAQLERKIAAVFEPDIAYAVLQSCRLVDVLGDTCQLKLIKDIELSGYIKLQLLQEVQAVYGSKVTTLEILPFTKNSGEQAITTTKTNKNYLELAGLNPNSVWYKVRQYLIELYGEAVDKSWFSKLELIEEDATEKQVKLKPTTDFIRYWVNNKYLQDLRVAFANYGFQFEMMKA